VARRGDVSLSAVAVRRATPEDAAAVAVIQVRGSAWAYRDILPQHEPIEARVARRTLVWRDELAADRPRHTFIAERHDDAVGFVTCGPSDDGASGEVFAIYLEPAVVGSGVGRALMDHAFASLRTRGFADAVLWVLEENARARQFYERGGWSLDGARKETVRDGHARHEIRYRRAL
jgi:ribosomal protein S18 acetylase RimI-like enzyme